MERFLMLMIRAGSLLEQEMPLSIFVVVSYRTWTPWQFNLFLLCNRTSSSL